MAFGYVHIAIAWVGKHVRRISQGFRRISAYARLPKRQQNFALRTELDDDAPFVLFSRKFLEVIRTRRTRVCYPHIAVSIDMDAVRPHKHSAAKAPDLFTGLIEMVDWIRVGSQTTRRGPGRTSIGCPNCFAIAIDGNAVR